jgi:predicted nucleic acid-binding protein
VILVDTSAWIDHFRTSDPVIVEAITTGRLATHDYVIAELALGSVPDRRALLSDLGSYPRLAAGSCGELLEFIESAGLASKGIGLVDASLLLSSVRADQACIWTRDKRLMAQAERFGVAYSA